jgi:pimeloyl-ACP methyl ester carboxylesterase
VQVERTRFLATTSDGLRLSIVRVAPSALPAHRAVVLLHGLGANRMIFLAAGASLAQHLAELGFDCYVPELRGAGHSERPRAGWTLDDYLERDIPAVLESVLHASGQTEVSCIGHSMGGVLMLMYGIEHPDAPISRLVTVGAALDYRPGRNVYQDLRRLRPFAGFLREVPFGAIARAVSPLAGIGPTLPPEGMNFQRANVERSVCREIMACGFGSIPLALFDSLTTTFDAQGFSRNDGRIVYLARAKDLRIPTLLIAGSRDPQCSPEAITATLDSLSGVADKRALFFGRAHGQREDYGHLDLLVGKHAAVEVWPQIGTFVRAERSVADGASATH